MQREEEFYLRYFVGHKGEYGHEYLEFEFTNKGVLRYANNSAYKNESLIKRQVRLHPTIISQLYTIITESGIMQESGKGWPQPSSIGRQELECVIDGQEKTWITCKLGSMLDIQNSKDPEGLKTLYFLVQDLKSLVMSLITSHFKVKPI